MRKGIWLGEDDLYLIEKAKEQHRSFSDYAKVSMRYYDEQHALAIPEIARAVVDLLEERGLILASDLGEPQAQAVDTIRRSMDQFD